MKWGNTDELAEALYKLYPNDSELTVSEEYLIYFI
jgi:Fe-S-cluster formation regulator IscX/YfhJ